MITDEKKYYGSLKNSLLNFFKNDKKVQIFIFGSSVQDKQFGDIDIGIIGEVTDMEIRDLKEFFEESTFPFFVDIINFNKVEKTFKDNVLNNKVLWIKH